MTPDGCAGDIVAAFDRAAEPDRRDRVGLRTDQGDLRFGEVVLRARQFARFAAARGWALGSPVVIATRDPIACVSLHLACMRNGFASVVADPESPPPAAQHLLETVRPAALFVDHDEVERWATGSGPDVCEISSAAANQGWLFEKLLGANRRDPDRYPGCFDSLEPADLPERIDPTSDAYVLFTSGSTAAPKGVRVSHSALFAHLGTLSRVFEYDESARLLNVLPLHHTDGMNHGPVVAFATGGCAVRPFPFSLQEIEALLDSVYTHRITHWITVPTLLALVSQLGSDAGEDWVDSFVTDDFRGIVCSAAPLATSLWEDFQSRFRTPVANVYGLTETVVGGLFSGGSAETPCPGTVGVPVDCEARLVDDSGNALEAGPEGELELRGANVFSGYFGDDDATRAAFRDDWFRTGDLATRDPDGRYRITGRRKNLVIRGGVNIHPEEISEALVGIREVVEAVAFGEPDPIFGERAVACVTLFDGSEETEASLLRATRALLTPAKIPSRIYVLPALPKGDSGKIQLERVRTLIAGRERHVAHAQSADVEASVLAIAAACFERPDSSLDTRSTPKNTPGWDSFAHLEFVVAIEDHFEIRLTTRDILRIEDLGVAIEVVREHLA
jgi:long-chain acyl-CoA synthetase